MSARTITVVEGQFDKAQLTASGYKFHIAKSVVPGPGEPPKYNTIWQSKAIAPKTMISWNANYGLNWAAVLPDSGVAVSVGGEWQAINKGQSVKLNSNGYFDSPTAGGMDGVKNASGDFDPIFIDPRATFKGGSARYSPIEKVQCWYEAGGTDSTIISQNRTGVMELDCTNPTISKNAFAWWINYVVSGAAQGWNVTESKPMQSLIAPPPSKPLPDISRPRSDTKGTQFAPVRTVLAYPIVGIVVLAIGIVTGDQRERIVQGIISSLAKVQLTGNVKFTAGDLTMTISYYPSNNSSMNATGPTAVGHELAPGSTDPLGPIKLALDENRNAFREGEAWTITQGTSS